MATHPLPAEFDDSINTLSGGSQEQADRIRALLQTAFSAGWLEGREEGYEEGREEGYEEGRGA